MEPNASQRDPMDETDTYRDYVRRAERNEIRSKWMAAISAAALVFMLVRL